MKLTPSLLRNIQYMAIAALALLVTACGGTKETDEDEDKARVEKIRVAPIAKQTISNTFELTSTLEAQEEVYYAPASPGRIEKIRVNIGDHVRKGDLLVEMDQTQLQQARIQLKNLEVDMARFDTLIKTRSIPQQQYDQLKAQLEIARSNVDFLEQNSIMRAPFSGVVSGKFYQSGEMFSAAPNTPAGKAAVISLVQINPLKAVISISERMFPLIQNNMEVNIVTDIYPDKPFKGRINRIYPTIDPISRTFMVEVQVPNSDGLLRPGMFCRASINTGETEAIIVPSLAVLKVQGANDRYVFIEEGGTVKRVNVELGRRFDDKVELLSNGLKVGDHLVVSGQARLVDGVEVEVVN